MICKLRMCGACTSKKSNVIGENNTRLTVILVLVMRFPFVAAAEGLPPYIVGLPVILVDDCRPAHKQSTLLSRTSV